MKAPGPIPHGFRAEEGELVVAGRSASAWADAVGTPCFVYDGARVAAQAAHFRHAMPAGVALHYAVKANPFLPLLARLRSSVDGLDIASGGEQARAVAAGWSADQLSFAGPAKGDAELAAAVRAGVTINLESEGEATRALAAAAEAGVTPRLAVRVNPPFELRAAGLRMGGGATPFGIDAERAAALVRRLLDGGADWRGFHVYSGTQSLDEEAVATGLGQAVALAADLAREAGRAPSQVTLGGGFGVPYFAGDRPLDVAQVGARFAATLAARSPELADTAFAIELGRWLVAEAGVYLTRVIDRKESRGRTFLIVDGGLHHLLAATGNLGTVVRRAWPLAIATRFDAPGAEPQSVTGCLCTPLDRFAEDAPLPRAEPGDLVAIFMAGAYGASASPGAFLGHGPAAEVLA